MRFRCVFVDTKITDSFKLIVWSSRFEVQRLFQIAVLYDNESGLM